MNRVPAPGSHQMAHPQPASMPASNRISRPSPNQRANLNASSALSDYLSAEINPRGEERRSIFEDNGDFFPRKSRTSSKDPTLTLRKGKPPTTHLSLNPNVNKDLIERQPFNADTVSEEDFDRRPYRQTNQQQYRTIDHGCHRAIDQQFNLPTDQRYNRPIDQLHKEPTNPRLLQQRLDPSHHSPSFPASPVDDEEEDDVDDDRNLSMLPSPSALFPEDLKFTASGLKGNRNEIIKKKMRKKEKDRKKEIWGLDKDEEDDEKDEEEREELRGKGGKKILGSAMRRKGRREVKKEGRRKVGEFMEEELEKVDEKKNDFLIRKRPLFLESKKSLIEARRRILTNHSPRILHKVKGETFKIFLFDKIDG